MDPLPRIFLVPGGDRRLRLGHPWVYANEIRMDAEARAVAAGSPAAVHRVDGKPLGVGTFNPHCLIAFRLFARDPAAIVDHAFLARRLERALRLRQRLFARPFYRLVHGEADGLPGLVVDRFDDVVCLQAGTAGMEALLPAVVDALEETLKPHAVVLRNDGAQRRLEGLEPYVRVARGEVDGPVEVAEGDVRFLADPLEGQKTGWFFDQRDNRAFMAGLSRGGRMLDVYCYGGGFALAAAAAGATEVLAVDSSAPALDLAQRAARLNGLDRRCTFLGGKAFEELERLAGERFRVVAADPPAFVKSRKDFRAGLKGYRKLARPAAGPVAPGGFLFVASCSHNVDAEAFARQVSRGLADAGRHGSILRASGAGADHPVHPDLPESAYLNTLTLRLE